jgi:hypothetical protein
MDYSDHALACTVYGDCIYDEVQEGVKLLEAAWKRDLQKYPQVLAQSTKGRGWFFPRPIVTPDWLRFMLFQPERLWPLKLKPEQREMLHLMKATSALAPRIRSTPDGELYDEEQTLQAMKQLAENFQKQVAMPMWQSYERVSQVMGRKLLPLCEERYGECTRAEAEQIFQGDLERGLRLKTLNGSPQMLQVLPKFLEWISA